MRAPVRNGTPAPAPAPATGPAPAPASGPAPVPTLTPSSSYIALSKQDSTEIEDPPTLRKLLVLDLNGTLLHRSPNNIRARYNERARDAQGNFLPRLRPVHPRPYMPAFRSYLFHDKTKAWLDVMVWSSAQPHSVGDMVDKCFGRDKERLIAVWARDTLGLSNEHYFQKVQTIKDLEKPWSLLAPKSSITSSPQSSVASTPRNSPPPSSPSLARDDSTLQAANGVPPSVHSALTTLLLDDSPLKAELQPYNHVCIGEYSGDLRARDVDTLQKEQDWNTALQTREQLDSIRAEAYKDAPDSSSPQSPIDERHDALSSDESRPPAQEMSKKRKRKMDKLHKRLAVLEQVGEDGAPEFSYDNTLLAVIGVLDEIKSQGNVAAWIRSGGLWGPHGASTTTSPQLRSAADTETDRSPRAGANEDDEVHSDDSTLSVDDGRKPGREGSETRNRVRKRKRKADSSARDRNGEVVALGNDGETRGSTSSLRNGEPSQEDGSTEVDVQKMWFEDSEVIAYWVARGRKALEELDISIDHGLDR
ncbi:hypothetical protein C8Q80DRAFT_1112108 [Daedaleopsis nitida]|nr:hypothetical protein C8Q80DRAFT_1112108 [Daedaleopsis nitida]